MRRDDAVWENEVVWENKADWGDSVTWGNDSVREDDAVGRDHMWGECYTKDWCRTRCTVALQEDDVKRETRWQCCVKKRNCARWYTWGGCYTRGWFCARRWHHHSILFRQTIFWERFHSMEFRVLNLLMTDETRWWQLWIIIYSSINDFIFYLLKIFNDIDLI